MESYKPSEEEMKHAETMMTEKQGAMSNLREKAVRGFTQMTGSPIADAEYGIPMRALEICKDLVINEIDEEVVVQKMPYPYGGNEIVPVSVRKTIISGKVDGQEIFLSHRESKHYGDNMRRTPEKYEAMINGVKIEDEESTKNLFRKYDQVLSRRKELDRKSELLELKAEDEVNKRAEEEKIKNAKQVAEHLLELGRDQ